MCSEFRSQLIAKQLVCGMGFGGFPGWQFGQVFGLLSLALWYFPIRALLRKPKGERLLSDPWYAFAGLFLFTASMATIYIVSSAPLYEARARVADSIDITVEATGLERVSDNNYGPVSIFARRPNTWPVSCIDGRVRGSASVQLDGDLDFEGMEAVAAFLEQERPELVVQRLGLDDRGTGPTVFAVGENTSLSFTRSSTRDDTVILFVNTLCWDDRVVDGSYNCTDFDLDDCVDTLLDE